MSPAELAREAIWLALAESSRDGWGRFVLLKFCAFDVFDFVRVSSVSKRSSMEDMVRTTLVVGGASSAMRQK